MKLLALFVLYKEDDKKVKILQNEFNLESFGYFERRHVKQILVFAVRTVTERTPLNTRQSVKIDEDVKAMVHIYVRPDGLASAVFSDSEYPQRIAYTLLTETMDDFTRTYPSNTWANINEYASKMETMTKTLKEYQNPQEVDQLMNTEKTVDDTKEIMINTLVDILAHGEKLDDLVARSIDLSNEAKTYPHPVKQKNRCCNLF